MRNCLQALIDPCMFKLKKVIILAHVDDLIINFMTKNPIDDLLKSFKNSGDTYNWEMTVEGSVKEYQDGK
jgi:hypothetical protein